ncbi:type VI secretion system protein TssA [Shewanella marina]|uniref:type VI secretion system protein TssA n=1 Tax=Shewanella marina TaxID=487319 RepID=UPI00046F9321|nr:type VI secretion system protein TssA [Shewanella marina]
MDIKAYRNQITQAISKDNTIGIKLDDDSGLDFIESQMMKVGSLAHTQVQWVETEQAALDILANKSKDLKVLTHLLMCLQHQTTPERFILSIYLLADFIVHYWQFCYPIPGPRGALPRRKFFGQIIQRTSLSVQKIDLSMFTQEQIEQTNNALRILLNAAAKETLPVEGVMEVIELFKSQINKRQNSIPTQVIPPKKTVSATEKSTAPISAIEIDGSNERATKQTLLKVADFLSELDSGQMMAMRLRRFAIWCVITAIPDAEENGETQLMPVSADRVSEYEEQLKRGADLAILARVEQSISVAPFWLDGHFLSYRICQKMGKTAWAEAILHETQQFLQRLPELARLSFKGGQPFVSEACLNWLSASANNSSMSVASWEGVRDKAFSTAKEQGLGDALMQLNRGLKSAVEPRDMFYWRLIAADLMKQHQLTSMALQEYKNLLEQVQAMPLIEWEPSLIKCLENNSKDCQAQGS